jgi:hypothetical protein
VPPISPPTSGFPQHHADDRPPSQRHPSQDTERKARPRRRRPRQWRTVSGIERTELPFSREQQPPGGKDPTPDGGEPVHGRGRDHRAEAGHRLGASAGVMVRQATGADRSGRRDSRRGVAVPGPSKLVPVFTSGELAEDQYSRSVMTFPVVPRPLSPVAQRSSVLADALRVQQSDLFHSEHPRVHDDLRRALALALQQCQHRFRR